MKTHRARVRDSNGSWHTERLTVDAYRHSTAARRAEQTVITIHLPNTGATIELRSTAATTLINHLADLLDE